MPKNVFYPCLPPSFLVFLSDTFSWRKDILDGIHIRWRFSWIWNFSFKNDTITFSSGSALGTSDNSVSVQGCLCATLKACCSYCGTQQIFLYLLLVTSTYKRLTVSYIICSHVLMICTNIKNAKPLITKDVWRFCISDSDWARTNDLHPVKVALSQLSYGITL